MRGKDDNKKHRWLGYNRMGPDRKCQVKGCSEYAPWLTSSEDEKGEWPMTRRCHKHAVEFCKEHYLKAEELE